MRFMNKCIRSLLIVLILFGIVFIQQGLAAQDTTKQAKEILSRSKIQHGLIVLCGKDQGDLKKYRVVTYYLLLISVKVKQQYLI